MASVWGMLTDALCQEKRQSVSYEDHDGDRTRQLELDAQRRPSLPVQDQAPQDLWPQHSRGYGVEKPGYGPGSNGQQPPPEVSRHMPDRQSNTSNLIPNTDIAGIAQSFENPLGWWFGSGGPKSKDKKKGRTRGRVGTAPSALEGGTFNYDKATPSRSRTSPLPSRGSSRDDSEYVARRSSRDSAESEGDKDTTIGKGFSAQLKRGVAQAEKQAEEGAQRTQMVPQKDGGFVATIQNGFIGIFGHNFTSKEEVLRRRGPQPAPEYEAVPGDDIDQKVQYLARWLPQKVGENLEIYRVAKGQYEIGGEEVNLTWHEWVRSDGVECKEVFVVRSRDDQDEGKKDIHGHAAAFEPLPLYLQHSAAVATNLKNGHAITQVPAAQRMSFPDAKGHNLMDANGDQRFSAMALAAEQARLREHAALEYRRNSKDLDAVKEGDESEPESRDSSRGQGLSPHSSSQSRMQQMRSGSAREEAFGLLPSVSEEEDRMLPQSALVPGLSAPRNFMEVPVGPDRMSHVMLAPMQPAGPWSPPAAARMSHGSVPYGMPMQMHARPLAQAPHITSPQGTFYGASQHGSWYGVQQQMMPPVAFAR